MLRPLQDEGGHGEEDDALKDHRRQRSSEGHGAGHGEDGNASAPRRTAERQQHQEERDVIVLCEECR